MDDDGYSSWRIALWVVIAALVAGVLMAAEPPTSQADPPRPWMGSRQRAVEIRIFGAEIVGGGHFARDDSNAAPDAFVRVLDHLENTVFDSGQYLMAEGRMSSLTRNRNNYRPYFEGISFRFTFSAGAELEFRLMDFDGLEGVLGASKSRDDRIGDAVRIDAAHPSGRSWLEDKQWRLEIEIIDLDEPGA